MNRILHTLIIALFAAGIATTLPAQTITEQDYPLFGAQVFIEPGQTDSMTEGWFRTLRDNGMTVCRIRMFESYMHQDGKWDFTLFDRAFRYAEKYHIKVLGTLFSQTSRTDIGGWKFPDTQQQLDGFAEYIKQVVSHFKSFRSLYGWVLLNEPGGGFNDKPYLTAQRDAWNRTHPTPDYLSNGYPVLMDLQTDRFKADMTTQMLQWIAREIRKYDTTSHLHVNNHDIFHNLREYNFPQWRSFLNSLGGSAHASWHYVMFPRVEYDIAMSANSEIIHSGAGPLPWIMTEIQGGNNTFSGRKPMCPTKEEIEQWLWVIIGTEGKGGIFWTLNPRASGMESGEWGLLDFQQQPTDRVAAIQSVSRCVTQQRSLFYHAKKNDSKISILYVHESLWTERLLDVNGSSEADSRQYCMNDMLGYFKALSEHGVTPNLRSICEYDFNKADYTGETIILAHQIALPQSDVPLLERFVAKGGRLIVDGLTGYYDENVHSGMLTGFPLQKLFGGNISEFRKIETPQLIALKGYDTPLPGGEWIGLIRPDEGTEILSETADAHPLATRHCYGKGEVIWIPTLLGLEWSEGDAPLADWLIDACHPDAGIRFRTFHRNMIMKNLKTPEGYITITINKSAETQQIALEKDNKERRPTVIYAGKGGTADAATLTVHPEETLVVAWK